MSTLFWTSLVAAAVYFGVMLVPVYIERFEVQQVLREAAGMARRGETSNDALRAHVLQKCKQIGSHYEIVNGEERTIPGLVLLADDVIVNRDEYAKTIILQVNYTKHVNYPFTERQRAMDFSPAVKGDLTPITW